jgi:serine/threonine-protein kinase
VGVEAGDSVGRFVVERVIGAGAMGVVYVAHDPTLDRRVALKILRPSPEHPLAELRSRLVREARALSAVRHPNVVPIHDVLETDEGLPVLVMDLLRGESLRARLQREGRLPLSTAARIMVPVLSALEAAHALGVIHRDLKPDNIFLASDDDGGESVRILDFGIAKLTRLDAALSEGGDLTRSGTLVGTPYYMAPEQAFGEKEIDGRADLWSVGVVLYECLTGVRPTQGENLGQVLKTLTSMAIRPVEEVLPGLPSEVTALLGRLLSERGSRPGSASEVVSVLERYLDDTSAAASSLAPLAPLAEPARPAQSGPPLSSSARRPRQSPMPAGGSSQPRLWLLAGGGLLLVAAAVVAALLAPGRPGREPSPEARAPWRRSTSGTTAGLAAARAAHGATPLAVDVDAVVPGGLGGPGVAGDRSRSDGTVDGGPPRRRADPPRERRLLRRSADGATPRAVAESDGPSDEPGTGPAKLITTPPV